METTILEKILVSMLLNILSTLQYNEVHMYKETCKYLQGDLHQSMVVNFELYTSLYRVQRFTNYTPEK